VGTAAGAAFAAALISMGTAPAAGADTTDLNPFEDLFGTTGFGAWTPAVDNLLATQDPSLAATLDTHVDAFLTAVAGGADVDPIEDVVATQTGGAPGTVPGELALGWDAALYSYSPNLAATLDSIFDGAIPGAGAASVATAAATTTVPPDLDPFEDLIGSNNPFTSLAIEMDQAIASASPSLAASLDSQVDSFLGAVANQDADPFSDLIGALYPGSFSADGVPLNGVGDLAWGIDSTLYVLGVGPQLDSVIDTYLAGLTAAL
jgi:hypothetical protein